MLLLWIKSALQLGVNSQPLKKLLLIVFFVATPSPLTLIINPPYTISPPMVNLRNQSPNV